MANFLLRDEVHKRFRYFLLVITAQAPSAKTDVLSAQITILKRDHALGAPRTLLSVGSPSGGKTGWFHHPLGYRGCE